MPFGPVYAYNPFYVQKTVVQIQGVIEALKEGEAAGLQPSIRKQNFKSRDSVDNIITIKSFT